MFKNWLKIAFINYKKNYLSTIINVFGLTVGLTALMLVILHWKDEESFEKWNPNKDNIYQYQAYFTLMDDFINNISYPMARRIKEVIPEVEDYILIDGFNMSGKAIVDNKSLYIENGMTTTSNFFSLFPFKIIKGDPNTALQNTSSIAITKDISESLFGTINSIGRKISLENKDYIVSAVYEKPGRNTRFSPDFLTLSRQIVAESKAETPEWGDLNYTCYILFKKGASLDKVREEFVKDIFEYRAKILSKQGQEWKKNLELYGPNDVVLTRLDEIKLHAKNARGSIGDYRTILTLFSFSVLLVIMSAINFINLNTAQASKRAKEVGVRKTLGSSKFQLVIQFLLETFILTLFSYFLALALVELLLPGFNKFLGKNMIFEGSWLFIYSGLIVVVVTLVSGLVPAFYLSSFKPINTLKGNFERSSNGVGLRNIILTLQLVISSFFIIGSLIINKQIVYMMNKDLGFNGTQLYSISFNERSEKPWLKYERIKKELSSIVGVKSVTYGSTQPGLGISGTTNVDWKDKSLTAAHGMMDFGYLEALKVKLVKGRFLSPELSSDTVNSAIVNEALVRAFGWTNDQALQNKINPGMDTIPYNIIGVVKDFNISSPRNKVMPILFFHYKQTNWTRYDVSSIVLELDPNEMLATQARIQSYWEKNIEPGYPFKGVFINKAFAKTFTMYEKQQLLFNILNGLVLLVALLGLFALSSLIVSQKLKTVAIKKCLGASDMVLVKDLVKDFLWITIIAVFISFPITFYFMNEWLKDFSYRIKMPWWPYIFSLVALLILTVLVTGYKAYQSTKIYLVKYLKYE